jgi:hypothetical protein
VIDETERSLGRNDRCWCGSGRKYKSCHLAEDLAKEREQREEARAEAEEEGRGAHGEHLCDYYHPLTHKVAAVERPDFVVTVRNLASKGPGAWLHIDSPVDLGRDQATVDSALAFLRKYGVVPDFKRDPNPEVIASVQEVLDRLSGRGVFEVQPSGARLRRYGRTEVVQQASGSAYTAYLSDRGSLHGVVQLLLEAATFDAVQLGVTGGLLAHVWPVARVTREVVRNNLSLAEPLQNRARALVGSLTDQISQAADRLDEQGASPDVVRAQATLPYLVGLKEALSDPLGQLEGMGLGEETVGILAVHLETAMDGPPWLLNLAALAGEDWDTPEGYRAWLESARTVAEVADSLDELVPHVGSSDDLPVTSAGLATLTPGGSATVVPDEPVSTTAIAPIPVISEVSGPSTIVSLFNDVDAGLQRHAARRQALSDRLAEILDRRQRLGLERSELQAKLEAVDAQGEAVNAEQAAATRELETEAEAEERFRREAVRAVIASGAARLGEADEASPAREPAADWCDGDASLVHAERTLRDREDMERRGLLEQLPSGVRAIIDAEVADARAVLREALGGRDPLTLPTVVSASEGEAALTLSVGIPISRDDELAPGSLRTAVAVAIADALADVARSVHQIDVEAVDHLSWSGGGSVLRMRFSGPPPVTADDCAQYCAAVLRDAGDSSASLRTAGVSLEARVEPDLEVDD